MRKEIIFAILVGSSLGVAVAFGIWRVNVFFKTNINIPPAEQENTKQDDEKTNNEYR